MEILDVTQIDIRHKHRTIFQYFDALKEGGELLIENDHDPKPLYYQLVAERNEIFGWEYIQKGPVIWKVKITKKADGKDEPIGEIVARDFRTAEIFKKYGIDFCCGGKRTLSEVCRTKGVSFELIKKELHTVEEIHAGNSINATNWNLDFLAEYIVNNHHSYVADSLPFLLEISNKVAIVHGEHHPEVIEIDSLLRDVAQELTLHMKKEELILFPYIKQLAVASRSQSLVGAPPFGSIANPIEMMEEEHEQAGGGFKRIAELSHSFSPPEDACTSYRVLYSKLKEFQDDLHQHIHLENNILFPKSLSLEQEVLVY